MPGILYILFSQKLDRFYVGSTDDMDRRLDDHNRGQTPSTRSGIPWELRFTYSYDSLRKARAKERYLKSLKSRKILEMIVNQDHSVIRKYVSD